MENATQALIMAGSVLLLIIALTVSISSFTSLKTQVETIISEKEETDLVTDDEGNYLNYIEGADDIRTVGVETVISTVRRVKSESYTVYIYGSNVVNDVSDNADTKAFVHILSEAQEYNKEIIIPEGSSVIVASLTGKNSQNLTETSIAALRNILKGYQFKEYLGIYQEDTETSSANRTTYRIITFVETGTNTDADTDTT